MELASMARRQVASQALDPFVKVWREKSLTELLEHAPAVAADATTLALAGFIHAMSAGWEVSATAVVVKQAMEEARARSNAAEVGTQARVDADEHAAIIEDASRLALARAFGAVDTVRVLHSEFTRALSAWEAEQKKQAAPHDTEAG